jgi:integrase
MATLQKRGKTWRAQIRRNGYPTVTHSFNRKADAQAWAREIEREMDKRTFIDRTEAESTTLEQALQRYLREITPAKKGAAQETSRINAWLERPLAKYALTNIHGADLAAYRDERLAEGKCPTTVRNDINIISHLFTIAKKEWGMECLINPVQNIRMPKQPTGRTRRLMQGEEKKLLEAANYPLKQMIVLALETAMRLGEILSITWANVNLNEGILVLEDTKNGERRSVPLSARARATLKELPRNISGRVFPSVTNSAISHSFRCLCNDVEIEGLRFHDLRHEATSRLFEKGLGLMEVASITGHKTLHMLKRYTHLRAVDLVKKLG